MIASFSKKFIFAKTRKTGGTSAEIILSSWCEKDDICSTISGTDELLRKNYGGKARNFSGDANIIKQFEDLVLLGNANKIQAFRKSSMFHEIYYNHMTCLEIKKLLPQLWDVAHVFTVERHPYERAISAAWWAGRDDNQFNLSFWIDRVVKSKIFPNYPIYTDGKDILVDEVIPSDELDIRLKKLASSFGCPVPDKMLRAKGAFRRDRSPAEQILNNTQKAEIYERTALEFEIMGFIR